MKTLTLLTLFAAAAFIAGCGSSAEKPAANATVAKAAEQTAEPAAKTNDSVSTAVTGVAQCDEYLAKLSTLVDNPKIPQSMRDTYKQSLEQNRTAWKQAASTPQGKAGLETSCTMALESIKPALAQFAK